MARLEGTDTGAAPSYVVRVSAETLDDDEAVHAAIAEHRRCTGWMGPVMLAPARMTLGTLFHKYGDAFLERLGLS